MCSPCPPPAAPSTARVRRRDQRAVAGGDPRVDPGRIPTGLDGISNTVHPWGAYRPSDPTFAVQIGAAGVRLPRQARAARQAGKAGDRGGSGDFAGDCVRRWRDRDRTCSSRCCVRSGFRRGYFERALDARPRPAMAITWQKLLALELAVTDLGAAPAKSASRTRRARASGRRFFSGPALRRRRRGGDRVGCP